MNDTEQDGSAPPDRAFLNEAQMGQGAVSPVRNEPPEHIEKLAQELGKLVGPFLANKPPTVKGTD